MHRMFRRIRKAIYRKCTSFCRCIFCNFCSAWKKRKRQSTTDGQTSTERKATLTHFRADKKLVRKKPPPDQVSEAGTFEGFYFALLSFIKLVL